MAENRPITTLLIGLGGSGAWTITHVKRQLFDAFDNRVPENIGLAVLDTAKKPISKRGAEGRIREEGQGIGQTVLDRSEIAHVGGDSYDLVREIDSTNHYPHIKSWFLSSDFLASLPRASFALDEGAGQFRQFGRLALFRDVMAPATSSVAAIIETKLKSLAQKKSNDDPAISVMLVGSLAGGTGAGLFLDIPHLIQRVAEINTIDITLRGFFYLPDAFRGTLSDAELEPAQGRAFAALRELSRFLLNSNYDIGYPMHYHAQGQGANQNLWRDANRGKLYDYVYLVDGTGMNQRKLEEGVASAVADAIVNFIDPNYGPKHAQYDVNIRGKIADRQSLVGKKAFVSALGAYSIILPIQQITESWAHRLCLEILDELLPGEKDENNQMVRLRTDGNPEQTTTIQDEIQRIAKSMTPISDPRDPQGKRQLMPLPLWGRVFDIYSRPDTDHNKQVTLSRNDLVDWLEWLVPPAQENDPEVASVRSNTVKILQQRIEDFVQTSDQKKGGDPERDAQEIRQRSERYINQQLGMPATGGGRQGGDYDEKLRLFIELQVTRYRGYMAGYINRELNGEARRDSIRAKSGKLGWLIAVFTEMREMFATVTELLDNLRTGSGSMNISHRRGEVEETLVEDLRSMDENRSKKGMLGLGRSDAVKAQRTYLKTVQEYVDFYRMEFARDAVAQASAQITAFTDEILRELKHWRDLLALEVDGLHNRIANGRRMIKTDRDLVSQVANHRVIDDPDWEDQRYRSYINQEVLTDFFTRWQWQIELVAEGGGRERMSVNPGLVLGSAVDAAPTLFRRDRKRKDWAESNSELMLGYARAVFRDAIRSESVLNYVMQGTLPVDLADELADRSGYLLNFPRIQDASSMIPGYILLARHDPNNHEQLGYIRDINTRLAARNNQGDTSEQDTPTQIYESCADPFRITLLSTAELIPMEAITSYRTSKEKYEGLPYDTRQKNHIFPAEVHAITYEERLHGLPDPDPRLLTDRVCLLLENEERFIDFLFLMAYRLVVHTEVDTDGTTLKKYWSLRAASNDANHEGMIEWKLTNPVDGDPPLLDAMISYVINGHASDNRNFRIPYDHIKEYLRLVQDHNTAKAIQGGEIARHNTTMRQQLQAFEPPLLPNGEEDLSNWTEKDDEEFLEIARFIARYDILMDLYRTFATNLPQAKTGAQSAKQAANNGETHDNAIRQQELYDLFSVAMIALRKEMDKYGSMIETRYLQRTNTQRGHRL